MFLTTKDYSDWHYKLSNINKYPVNDAYPWSVTGADVGTKPDDKLVFDTYEEAFIERTVQRLNGHIMVLEHWDGFKWREVKDE